MESKWITCMRRGIEEGRWKSVLFYSQQLLRVRANYIEALVAHALSLYCSNKLAELEQFMTSLSLDVLQNEQIMTIRCNGLMQTKDYTKIIAILGGDPEAASIVIPIIQMADVMKSERLKALREAALFNASQTDEYSRPKATEEQSDPLNPSKVTSMITEAMMKRQPELLEKFGLMADKTTEADPLILTACGCNCWLNGQTETGDAFFMKAVEEDPDCEIAWLCLLTSFIEASEWDQGLSTLRKLIRRFPGSDSVSMFAVSLHLKSGSPTLARPWISKSDIDCLFVRHERGVACLMENDCEEAVIDFEVVLASTQEKDLAGAASLNLGHCMRRLGNFKRAIELYQNALANDTKPAEALASIGFTHHLQGNIDDAILFYNHSLSVDPVHPFATKMLDVAIQYRY